MREFIEDRKRKEVKANLINDAKELVVEGHISKVEDVSKHFAPDEIALLSDFLVSLFQRKE